MLVGSFVRTYGLPAIIIRASNNYGPWQYPEKLIPLSIIRLLSGEKIPVYGKGENIRTWLYVEDFTYAVLAVMEKGKEGEVYNVGSGEEKKNIEVVKKILSLFGKDENYIEFVPDRPGHDLKYALDTTKIETELGWKPKVSFEEGIEKTVSWYIENKEWLFEKEELIKKLVKDLRERYAQK
jgi:dTDP-glucose 4,6-dehydratase